MVCVTFMWVSPRITAVSTRWLRLQIRSSNIKFPILPATNAVQREFVSLSSCTYSPMLYMWISSLHRALCLYNKSSGPSQPRLSHFFTGTSAKTRWPRPPWARPSRREAVCDWSPRKTSSRKGSLPVHQHHLLQWGRLKGQICGWMLRAGEVKLSSGL